MTSLAPTEHRHLCRINTKHTASNQLTAKQAYSRLQHLTALAPIVVLYLTLAFYQIDNQSLWTDEVISIKRTTEPIWARMYSQSPLYFALLGFWSKLVGTSEFALRSFSTLLGTAAVYAIYAIGYKFFNRKIAVFAAILLATSPYVIWYSQEVRYITLMLVTSLMMTYAFQRAIANGQRTWWLSYIVTSLLALFSFLTVVFMLVAHGLYLIRSACYRPVLRRWLVCQLIILLIFATWLGVRSGPKIITALSKTPTIVVDEQGRSSETVPLTDLLGAIPYTFYAFSVGFSLGPSVAELHLSRSINSLLSHAPIVLPLGLLYGAVFLLGIMKLRGDTHYGLFLMLWLAVPIFAVFLIATLTTYHVFNTRYVGMALPAYIIILTLGIVSFQRSGIQIVLLCSLLAVNAISLANYYFASRYDRADARAAAQYLAQAAGPRDVILAVGNATALQYYYKGPVPIVLVDRQTWKNQPAMNDQLNWLNRSHDRLWLAEVRFWEIDPKRSVKAVLDTLAHPSEYKSFSGVDLYAYNLPR